MDSKIARTRLCQHMRHVVRAIFAGLLALAIGVSIVSFLTACKCLEPFVPKSP